VFGYEKAYLSGTREFTKAQQRYIRCRLNKKVILLSEELKSIGTLIDLPSSVAANCSSVAAFCNAQRRGQELSDVNIMFERQAPNTERGSPSLVGRGIANPCK
jgi:hypothetical protein